MRRFRTTLGIFILAVLGYLGFNIAVDHGIINMNSIKVSVNEPLEKEKIKIVKSVFSINRKSDSELFYDWTDEAIVFSKNKHIRPETEHGENDFLVTYDDKYYFQFRQGKTGSEMNDTYSFHLTPDDTSIYLEVKIEPNGLKFKRKMNLIKNSNHLLTNVPLDSVGGVYNGIELR